MQRLAWLCYRFHSTEEVYHPDRVEKTVQAYIASRKHVASEDQFAWNVIQSILITRTGSNLISGYGWRVCVVTDNTHLDECVGRYDDVWEDVELG